MTIVAGAAASIVIVSCLSDATPELGETSSAIVTSWAPVAPATGARNFNVNAYRSGEVTDIDSVAGAPTALTTAWGGYFLGDGFAGYLPRSEAVPTGMMRSVARYPGNPDIAIVATGSSPSSAGDDWGLGLYYTPDAGITWQQALPGGGNSAAWRFEKVRWGSGSTVFGISNRGIWRSTAYGAPNTWNAVYTTPTYAPSSDVLDIAVDPDLPTWVYVVTGDGRLLRSIDSGATWVEMALPLTLRSGAPFDRTRIQRGTRLAVSKLVPSRVYMMVADTVGLYGLFHSTSFGNGNWIAENPGSCTIQPTYFMSALAVSPTNSNIILAAGGGNTQVCRSTDAGMTWAVLSSSVLHVDYRALTFSPSGLALLGSDGGIFSSNDNGATWSSSSNLGLPAPVLGSFDVSAANPGYQYMTTWDTGIWSTINHTYWVSQQDEDSRDIEADPTNALRAWAVVGNTPGSRRVTVDGGLTFDGFDGNLGASQFNTVVRGNGGSLLFTAHNGAIYQTAVPTGPRPLAPPYWTKWPSASTKDFPGTIGGLTVQRSGGSTVPWLYAWLDNSAGVPATKLYVFDPTQGTWRASGIGYFASTSIVSRVATSTDGHLAYALTDDNKIYRSGDFGVTWLDVTGVAPSGMYDVLIDPSDLSHVFVGTSSGVFQSITQGVWRPWSRGLPAVSGTGARIAQLRAITISGTTYLYAGVLGRGVFRRDVLSDP